MRSELLSANAESKSCKDDSEAKAKQIIWLEEQLTKSQEQVATTRKEAAKLRADQGEMVQRSELEALQTQLNELDRTSRLEIKRQRENSQALNEKLSSVDSERAACVNKMQVCISEVDTIDLVSLYSVILVLQGMVDRAELLAARSEIKALREDAQAKATDLTWSEAQLVKAREQLELARLAESQLRAEASSKVPKSELEAAKAHLHEVQMAASEESQKLRESLLLLKSNLRKLEEEKTTLEAAMMVIC